MDIEENSLNKKYDLIISNATFQWFNNLEDTIGRLGKMLKKNGVLSFSTFVNMTFNELHNSNEIARKNLGIKEEISPGQKFLKIDELLGICRDKLAEGQPDSYDITKNEYLEYEYFNIESVKKTGANNSRHKFKNNIALTREMLRIYEETYKIDNHIRATYHCILFSARKVDASLNERKLVN